MQVMSILTQFLKYTRWRPLRDLLESGKIGELSRRDRAKKVMRYEFGDMLMGRRLVTIRERAFRGGKGGGTGKVS
jgi:hypothetical protein